MRDGGMEPLNGFLGSLGQGSGRLVGHPEAIFTSGKGTTYYPPKVGKGLGMSRGRKAPLTGARTRRT